MRIVLLRCCNQINNKEQQQIRASSFGTIPLRSVLTLKKIYFRNIWLQGSFFFWSQGTSLAITLLSDVFFALSEGGKSFTDKRI